MISRCNPYNDDNVRRGCKGGSLLNPDLAIPEKPYIKNIKNTWDVPFVDIEKLRTPIDGFYINVKAYPHKNGRDDIIFDETFTVFRYQAYLPKDLMNDDFYYVVTCVAYNEAGTSLESNEYLVDHTDRYACYNYEIDGLTCGTDLCCLSTMVYT